MRIRPVRNSRASRIILGIGKSDGTFDVWAGQNFGLEELPYPQESIADYCQAIASGGLTEELRLLRDRVVGSRGWLRLPNGRVVRSDRGFFWDEIRRLTLGRFLGGESRRLIQYPPYDEVRPDGHAAAREVTGT